ncbi:hypothetical protein T439DRAFT_379954 [Meredithblackwellia eburnea MCA 4105]
MFSKSKRFDDKVTASDIPGPGAYNVPDKEPLAPWKKGAIYEKAERFREGEEGPDNFGMYDTGVNVGASKENRRPRAPATTGGGLPAEKVRVQMEDLKHKLQSSHEKEIARLEAKLARAEQASTEAKADNAQLRTELRTSQHSLTSLTSKLAKSEASLKKHQEQLPTLKSQFEQLTTSNAASQARKDATIAELNAAKTRLEGLLTNAKEDLGKVGEELEEAREENDDLQEDKKNLLAMISEARNQLDHQSSASKSAAVSSRQALDVATSTSHSLQLRTLHLERILGDRSAVIEALGDYSAQLEDELADLQDQLDETERQRDWYQEELRWERSVRVGGEKEWRQRCRSERRELDGARSEIEFERKVGRVLGQVDRVLRDALEDQLGETERASFQLTQDLEVAEGELELALEEELPKLEEERNEALARAEELEEIVEEGRVELVRLEKLTEATQEENEKNLGELEEIKRLLNESEKVLEKERGEKRNIAKLLGQSRAAESGLRDELHAAIGAYEELQSTRDEYSALARTLDEMARRNALAEADAKQLSELNTDLLSHGNTNQRIRHVAQIRAELDQSKKSHLATTSALATAQREISSLKEELEAYRAVSTLPSSTTNFNPTRSRAIRTSTAMQQQPQYVESAADDYLGISTAGGQANGMRISLGAFGGHAPLQDLAEEDTYDFALPPPPPPGGREPLSRSSLLPAGRLSLASGRTSLSGAPPAGGRKAGRVVVTDFDKEQEETTARDRKSGGIRMQGYMSVSELLG